MQENLASQDVDLTPEDLIQLDKATVGIIGARYSGISAKWVGEGE